MSQRYADPRPAVIEAFSSLLPPPDISGSAWAAEYRVLSPEDSGAPGHLDPTSRPYQNEIEDCACDATHEFTTVLGPSQWGKTFVGLNIIGRTIHVDPGPMMVVHPTLGAAQKWSKTRFTPMIRDCPVLFGLVAEAKSRDSGNTILEKSFRGGVMILVGANAPTGLASQPIKYLVFEELDRIPLDKSAGKEGDPETLAIARTTDPNFIRVRKIYRSTSPTIAGRSRGERAWNESDKRYWFFKCPHCGHEQRLFWENVIFDKADFNPDAIFYACSGAGCEIEQSELSRAIREGRWVATRPEVKNHAGFWIHGLMIRSMAYCAAEFLEARKGGSLRLQSWKNTCLGELWNPVDGEAAQVNGLLERARQENYSSGTVPSGVGILAASIDVQDDRLELLLEGFGTGGEKWDVLHEVIPGNLATKDPWNRAEDLLNQAWPRQDGRSMRVRIGAVDIGGHFSKHVYAFCRRPNLRGRIWPVKGATKAQTRLVLRSGSKLRLYLVDTVTAKDEVYGCLKIDTPGPGYHHSPNDTDASWFEQILAERSVSKGGRRAYEKISEGVRNEALDLEVYALAALAIFNPRDLEALVSKAGGATKEPELPTSPIPIEPDPQQGPRVIQEKVTPRIILPRRAGFPRGFSGPGSGAW